MSLQDYTNDNMDWSSSGNAETENLTSICPDNQQISHDNPVKGKQEK